jgi:elongation factor 1-gamma
MGQLRVFSYLPNPRLWKATITARLIGIELEIRGSSPKELQSWLWDFDARPLSGDEERVSEQVRGRVGFSKPLRKTRSFLEAHPFGTVPAAFSPDGKIGIFESNSIMRAVARLGEHRMNLYGRDAYEASRIDSFLDASLVFARDSQIYLLALGTEAFSTETYHRMRDAFQAYLRGINQALSSDLQFIAGEHLSLADICFVAEIALFHNEEPYAAYLEKRGLTPILNQDAQLLYPCAVSHFARLSKDPGFAPDVLPYLEKIDRLSASRSRTSE